MRKIFSALLGLGGGVSLMLQVGSHDAGTNFCSYFHFWSACLKSLPAWFDQWAWVFPAVLIALAIGILAWTPILHLFRIWKSRHGLIELKDAAAQIYGELRGTDLGRFTEGHTGEADEILDNMGMQILHNADVWVRRLPSPKHELFPKSELSRMGVCNGATEIRYWGQQQAYYSDPKVSRRDIARVAKELVNANFIKEWSRPPPKQIKEPDDIARNYPNVRTAEFRRVIDLFDGSEKDKIIPLLEAEKLSAWARLMGSGEPPLTKIGGAIWKTHYLLFLPKEAQWNRSQTFLKTKARSETSYYDLHLNKVQIEAIWPHITEASPLEIIFDSANPAGRFWSRESPKDEHGNKKPGVFWEYRVDIKNTSAKTIKNVSVTIEHIGGMSIRPVDTIFDKIGKTTCDLKPGCAELVPVIRWPIPIAQAGMLANSSALAYGPVKIIASGDDIQPSVRIFQFDYQREPMIFD